MLTSGVQEEGPAGDRALAAGASVEAEPVKPAAEEPQVGSRRIMAV